MRGTERRPDLNCQDSQEVAVILNAAKVLWDAVNILKDDNAELAIREYTGDDRESSGQEIWDLIPDITDHKRT